MIANVALMASFLMPAFDSKVDFECPAMNAGMALAQLTARTGLTLRADGEVASDILVIRANGVPMATLMAKIAFATGGTWSREGHAITLTASPEAEKRNHLALARELAGRIKTALQAKLDSPALRLYWNQEEAKRLAAETEQVMNPPDHRLDSNMPTVKALFRRGPVTRAFIRLLSAIGSDELAGRAGEGRVVYATEPTAMQVAIPDSRGVLDQYLAEQTSFVDATNLYRSERLKKDVYYSMPGIDRGTFGKGDSAKGVGKAIIRVKGSYRDSTLAADMLITDAAGKILNDGTQSLQFAERPRKPFDPRGDDSPVPPNSLASSFYDATSAAPALPRSWMSTTGYSGDQTRQLNLHTHPKPRSGSLTPALRKWIMDPVLYEPFQIAAGALLLTSAQHRNENLVADLDDRCFAASLDAALSRPAPSQWLSSSALQRDQNIDEDGGWLTVTPRDLGGARRKRISRVGLANFLAGLDRSRVLKLGDIGEFAQTQDAAPSEGGMDMDYMEAICPRASNETYKSDLWPTYRFFGTLSPEQRQALARGARMNMASLPPTAETALRRLVFEADEDPDISNSQGKTINLDEAGIVKDWTQLLPGGLPSGTIVAAAVTAVPGVYCLASEKGVADVESPTDLALTRFVNQSPLYRDSFGDVAFDRFVPATLVEYRFKFAFGEGVSIQTELRDAVFEASEAPRPLEDMPDAFRSAMDKEYNLLSVMFAH